MTQNLYAVIPSGQRPEELRNLLWDLSDNAHGGVHTIVVDTGYDRCNITDHWVTVIKDHGPINISRWWNAGLKHIYSLQDGSDDEFTVAVLNDDLRVPPRFVERLNEALNFTHPGAAAACPAPGMRTPTMLVNTLKMQPRMLGYAFALRGSLRLLADENLVWWYGDNDLDWQARDLGGVMHVGGSWEGFAHLYPDSTTTGELAEQAGRDRETFIAKWGVAPW